MFTISAFYFGETLQANTTSAESEHFKNNSLNESTLSIIDNDAPATMIDYFFPFEFEIAGYIFFSKFRSINLS